MSNIESPKNRKSPSPTDVCDRVRNLGYATSRQVRLYGEEFEVVSDPVCEEDGVSIEVKSTKSEAVRVLRLPATVLQSVRGLKKAA